MTDYIFSERANNYFLGKDMHITRAEDGRVVVVNQKGDWWGVNVKAEYIMGQRSLAVRVAASNLADGTLSGLEEHAREFFWREVEYLALKHGFSEVYQEGRSGGWACVAETRNFESASPAEPVDDEKERIARWIDFCFDADDLRLAAERNFDERILKANHELQVELSEYADWVGADIRSLDGDIAHVRKLDIVTGQAALQTDGGWFSMAKEATLIRKADGSIPPRLTSEPIMEEVFNIIEARGNIPREQLDAWLEADDDHDPVRLYEVHIVDGVNEIEDRILGKDSD